MKKHWPVILFLFFYFAITAYKFISHPTPFYDWDESIYAQVGREMVREKSLVPLWQGQYWLDKPPLTPLTYGIVAAIIPVSPEISTRIFTLLLSITVLGLIYIFYYRLTKNTIIPLLTVIITGFTPVFLQRAQVLNVDVFLMVGWMGYLVFYGNFWLSMVFLVIGVLSKSLLGFYPLIGMLVIEIIRGHKNRIKPLLIQAAILSLWYLTMFAVFQYTFIKNQFLEAMVKRVTASIESHFGERVFYVTTLIDQIKIFSGLSFIGIFVIIRQYLLKRDLSKFVLLLFLVPWFLFLNITKTKIAWYIYPVIPQFAFLGVYFLTKLKKYKLITTLATIVVIVVIFNRAIRQDKFFTTYYSSYDQYYNLARYADKNCRELDLLIDPGTRQTYSTLKSMNLTISTTQWWGNHPGIVYYSDKKVDFIYWVDDFIKNTQKPNAGNCLVVTDTDLESLTLGDWKKTAQFKEIILLKK